MPRILSRCSSDKSRYGGSGDERVPCDGRLYSDGSFAGGCGEPCRFVMLKTGEGNPPVDERMRARLLRHAARGA